MPGIPELQCSAGPCHNSVRLLFAGDLGLQVVDVLDQPVYYTHTGIALLDDVMLGDDHMFLVLSGTPQVGAQRLCP